jgi:hypothetical protein
MLHTRTKGSQCQGCFKINDTNTCVSGDATPKPRDISVCLYCGAICEFDKELNLVPLNQEQIVKLSIESPEMYFIVTKSQHWIYSKIKKN